MIKKLTPSQLSTIQSNEGLKTYLNNLVQEQPFTPRSWLYESKDPQVILEDWLNILSTLEHGSEEEREVFQFDTSQLKKYGPQGGHPAMSVAYPEVIEPMFSLSQRSSAALKFSSAEWDKGVEYAVSSLRSICSNLRPAEYRSVVDDMRARDTLESNSGWPLFTRRNKPEVVNAAIVAAKSGDWKTYPAIALFRRYNGKLRVVWMYPMSTNLIEGSFFQPLQSTIITHELSFFAPWKGFETVRRLVTEAYDAGKFISATDFSSTDAHFTWTTSQQVLRVLEPLVQDKYRESLRESIYMMHAIPLIIGPETKCVGMHGVSSGSNWTNFIETVFDYELSGYVSAQTENQWKGLCAIGDDMSWISDKYDDAFAETMEQYGKDVGQEINAEKVTNSPDRVKFLQRLFQRGYRRSDGQLRGVYSTIRALKSSVYPERFHNPKDWSSEMFCARQYMILENCVDHPLFKEFVKYVVHGQKDLIPFARKSARELNKIHRESKLLPGLNPTYNQEKRDRPLSDFESVKLARKM